MYPMQIERVEDGGNGYGWSIVSLGDGIYELAILKDGDICYHTPITNDVVRGDWIEINAVLDEIEKLRGWVVREWTQQARAIGLSP